MATFEQCQRAYDAMLPPDFPDEDDEAREFWEEMQLERRIESARRW